LKPEHGRRAVLHFFLQKLVDAEPALTSGTGSGLAEALGRLVHHADGQPGSGLQRFRGFGTAGEFSLNAFAPPL